jgi:hypothetical protein
MEEGRARLGVNGIKSVEHAILKSWFKKPLLERVKQ